MAGNLRQWSFRGYPAVEVLMDEVLRHRLREAHSRAVRANELLAAYHPPGKGVLEWEYIPKAAEEREKDWQTAIFELQNARMFLVQARDWVEEYRKVSSDDEGARNALLAFYHLLCGHIIDFDVVVKQMLRASSVGDIDRERLVHAIIGVSCLETLFGRCV